MRNDFESNYLMHWGLKKGAKIKDHKYYERLGETGKYIYFYTKEAYEKYIKGSAEEVQKKLDETTKRMQKIINKGFKKIDHLFMDKSEQTIADLSTEGIRNEKRNVQKEKADANRRKNLSTISAKEKASEKAAARKAEAEAKRKAHLNELKQKGIEKKRKEREQLAEVARKQLERVKKNFCSDAEGSHKEDYEKHKNLKLKDRVMSREEDLKAVNPNLKYTKEAYKKIQAQYDAASDAEKERLLPMLKKAYSDYEGWSENCADCMLTYDLRRRGYDVQAARQTNDRGWTEEVIFSNYKGDLASQEVWANASSKTTKKGLFGEYETYKNKNGYRYATFDNNEINQIKKDMLSDYPEGSYGYINLNWQTGGSHAAIWSIENGDVVIRDPQTNRVCTLDYELEKSISYGRVRLDDKELSDKAYEYAEAEELEGDVIKQKRR